MSAKVIIGIQWGDEGKGKGADIEAADADAACRFQGANNAGHTLVICGVKIVLQHIPSGIIQPRPKCILGNGMLINPVALMKEIQIVEEFGAPNARNRIFVSFGAHLITPLHRILDALTDEGGRIGTTQKGIGPAYSDKMLRIGLQTGYARKPNFAGRVHEHIAQHIKMFPALKEHVETEAFKQDMLDFFTACEQMRPFLCDTIDLVNSILEKGGKVLVEGAQGTSLDIDLGTYPYATSSNTTIGGALSGLGIAHSKIGDVVGIVKAYTTRVGSGPFPTELDNDTGALLRKRGDEFGSVTGRPRRCGWIDLEQIRHAVRINGITKLWLTKLDILDTFGEIGMAIEYRRDGNRIKFSEALDDLENVTPVIATMPGWKQETRGILFFESLPPAARKYIEFIEQFVGVPVTQIGVGPGREDNINRE